MFSKAIFKQTLKANFKLWIIFTVITSAMLAVMIAVFEPTTLSGMTDMVKGTPLAAMMKNTTFLGMLASTFYSMHGILLPVIFIMMTANSLIASQVDRGSMAYLLSTPTKRSTVVGTQALYLITSLVVMFVIVTGAGLATIQITQSNVDINISDFIMLNVGLFLLMFATSGISFFFSCLFNLSKNSLALGAGIPVAFFLFQLMGQVSTSLEKMKYLSLNTLFDTNAILNGDSVAIPFIILIGVGIVLYGAGMRVFQQKDLPL
ncbi:ABC transporter permease [Bacillus mycoides]|uniref:ABC transporter permease n=1 Tax=Bacillus mycoides TaxID=1405 RepID=UPI00187A407E|nr:ABC transporter permease subunit [Bacillus mycoides]MBE7128485.1 ABC transporter permease subunit [Bacillus mycoides]